MSIKLIFYLRWMPCECIVQNHTLNFVLFNVCIIDKATKCTNFFRRYLCYSVTLCSWMQAVWNTVALGVTQNELAFLNRIAICDVGNRHPLLWQCTDTSPLQPHKICTATCRYISGQLHCLHTDQLPLTYIWKCLVQCKTDRLFTDTLFLILFLIG